MLKGKLCSDLTSLRWKQERNLRQFHTPIRWMHYDRVHHLVENTNQNKTGAAASECGWKICVSAELVLESFTLSQHST